MRKILLGFSIAGALLYAGVALADDATSTEPVSPSSLSYPIAELGDCGSQSECKAYCDLAANASACFSYAQAHKLMSQVRLKLAKAFASHKGPGGCGDDNSCKSYCADTSHTAECLSFAQSNNLIGTTTANLIKALTSNGGPGGCTSRESCMSYCSDVTHMDECRLFAQQNGLGKGREASSTDDHRMPPPRMGSSTDMMWHGSTTPPNDGRRGSTTPAMLWGDHASGTPTMMHGDDRNTHASVTPIMGRPGDWQGGARDNGAQTGSSESDSPHPTLRNLNANLNDNMSSSSALGASIWEAFIRLLGF